MKKSELKTMIKEVLTESNQTTTFNNIKVFTNKRKISPQMLVAALDNKLAAQFGIEDVNVDGITFAEVRKYDWTRVNEVLSDEESTGHDPKFNSLLSKSLRKSGWYPYQADRDELLAEYEGKKYALTIREISE